MKKIEIKDFIKFNFLSAGKLNDNKTKYAYCVSRANLEKNSYDKNIYVYDLELKESLQLTSNNSVISFEWLDNNTIVYLNKNIGNDKDKALISSISLKGGESKDYLRLDKEVNAFKIIDSNTILITSTIELYEKMKGIDKDDYEILDEIPFWLNGAGFTNKKRESLFLYNIKTKKYIQINEKYSNVESFKLNNNAVYYIASQFSDKMDIFNGLYRFDLKDNKNQCLIEDNLYEITDLELDNEDVYIVATDTKKYGINQNPILYKFQDKNLKEILFNDEYIGNNVGSDAKLGSGKTLQLYNNKIYYTGINAYYTALRTFDMNANGKDIISSFDSIDFFDIIDENNIVFVGTKDYELQEVYLYTKGNIKCLTKHNKNILNKQLLSIPEHITFKSNDEVDIDGFIIKPLNYDSSKKYPCILDIHGGPKTAYGKNYFHEMQVWANNGYFVIFCNPRGSDGKGDEFADIRGKYGTIDYEDIMNFVDECVKRYSTIDVDNIGVTGGSYGGFMTNWIIGHTNRFKAAVSQRSISNWISKFNTTDIGYYFNKDQISATPWENFEKLWWHSPIKYADKVTTPTLFIHSEQDYRCWLAEGLQMFTALKYHNVPARLCMFKGENHDLSRTGKPLHRIKRLEEITNWFNRYLK